ncbi:MAG: LysM peptidoglycan-binding domain-containing protein [Deltaproteobacteria bacterium]|nr:LysM peptidoglycan-binding domain-containing protein [Deltaproteobacteria bacterium]
MSGKRWSARAWRGVVLSPVLLLVACRSFAQAQDVEANPAGRRAVRGRAVDVAKLNESPSLAALRAWEEQALASTAPDAAGSAATQPEPPEWLRGMALGDLPVRWDRRVVEYLRFYKDEPRGRSLMRSWLEDQGKFGAMIERVLVKHGLPRDLLCVALIESSFWPGETSRVGAAGLWQFMPEGGTIYGLEQDFWLDERRDPEKSTEAAALYLDDLHTRFGSWDLALAAYNAGYNGVLRAIARFNSNDFWALLEHEAALPWESTIYVPKAQACAVIQHNRERFGFADVQARPRWEGRNVTVPPGTSLATLARELGVEESALATLNPELRRGRTPPDRVDAVRIPRAAALTPEVMARLEKDAAGRAVWVVRRGETLDEVAALHGISAQKLLRDNGVRSADEVTPEVPLLVPRLRDEERVALARALARKRAQAPLLVALPPAGLAARGDGRVFYRVQKGDELGQVARALGTSSKELVRLNGLDPGAALQPRMVLAAVAPKVDRTRVSVMEESDVHVVEVGGAEHVELLLRERGKKRLAIKAAAGDSMKSLAARYDLSPGSLARINKINPSAKLRAGQDIIVYVDAVAWEREQAAAREREAERVRVARAAERKAADKKAADRKAAGKEVADKKAVGKEAVGKKAAGKEVAGKKADDEKVADKKAVDKKAAGKEAADKKADDEKVADKKADDEKAADKKADDEKAADEKAADEKAADKKAADKKAADKKAADKKAADEKAADEAASDRPPGDQQAADNQAAAAGAQ